MDGSQPVSPVTLQMLNSLIDTQTRLRDAAEARWTSAREALFGLARLVAADWLEQKQHEKGGLEAIRMEELSQVVYQHVSTLHAVSILPEVGQMQKASERIDELTREKDEFVRQGAKLGQEKQSLQAEVGRLEGENRKLSAQCEKLKNTPPAGDGSLTLNALPVPAWFHKWAASAGFERQSFVIRLMGDTGLARRPEIVKAIVEKFNLDDVRNGSVSKVIDRMEELGFLTSKRTAGTGHGAPPKVLALDALGETAYLFMTQKLPMENEYFSIRSAHSTDAHTILILKASNILAEEGYEIVSNGEINLPLPNGRISSPDIVASKNGQEIHVEVERDVNKGDPGGRERKWQNAFDAQKGRLYVFCETQDIQKKLVAEVNRALASESRLENANIFMTNLEVIDAGERHADGSIWVSQKHSSRPK
jgi:hypothetical protein